MLQVIGHLRSVGTCGAWALVQHSHVAKQVAFIHECNHALAMIERTITNRNCNATRKNDINTVGLIACFKEDISTH